MSTRDRALGALYGLAIGDALGMPTQSLSRAEIAQRYGVVDRLLAGAPDQPIAPNMQAGTITDDTEQALLLAQLLVEGDGKVDPHRFAAALQSWEQEMIRRGSLDLLGPSTKRALDRLASGEPAEQTGRDGTTNGAAMRVAPVGIAHSGETLLDAVVESCLVTHNTGLGIAAAAAVAAAVSAGVGGSDLPTAVAAAERAAAEGGQRGHWVAGGGIAARLRWVRGWVREIAPDDLQPALDEVVGTSVAANESVVAAFALVEALGTDVRAALTTAASLGGDTDTIAAICGAVLGAQHGMAGLPGDLLEQVRRVNQLDLDATVDGLLALRSTNH
ncbi:ADP-ribosylglycohydrolase family protein [Kribbella sandramycini]|uniref:ADP-ribosylglycohydrolase n=1 Tax=Kribbella sandramycini TaxID=60450 RepID=A0A7Y4L695_9ACTN|nr:ADP-ribosylglycohydrolase family protein [Kribbella sandramycini]MBB6570951.1 ADP-ribosylglycohydrolase [Kribbella sandramycini]NOL44081.1 ADP-ribosylglycohydrolase family protein [Kribbella sandramycini]